MVGATENTWMAHNPAIRHNVSPSENVYSRGSTVYIETTMNKGNK